MTLDHFVYKPLECIYQSTRQPSAQPNHFTTNHTQIQAQDKLTNDLVRGRQPPQNKKSLSCSWIRLAGAFMQGLTWYQSERQARRARRCAFVQITSTGMQLAKGESCIGGEGCAHWERFCYWISQLLRGQPLGFWTSRVELSVSRGVLVLLFLASSTAPCPTLYTIIVQGVMECHGVPRRATEG